MTSPLASISFSGLFDRPLNSQQRRRLGLKSGTKTQHQNPPRRPDNKPGVAGTPTMRIFLRSQSTHFWLGGAIKDKCPDGIPIFIPGIGDFRMPLATLLGLVANGEKDKEQAAFIAAAKKYPITGFELEPAAINGFKTFKQDGIFMPSDEEIANINQSGFPKSVIERHATSSSKNGRPVFTFPPYVRDAIGTIIKEDMFTAARRVNEQATAANTRIATLATNSITHYGNVTPLTNSTGGQKKPFASVSTNINGQFVGTHLVSDQNNPRLLALINQWEKLPAGSIIGLGSTEYATGISHHIADKGNYKPAGGLNTRMPRTMRLLSGAHPHTLVFEPVDALPGLPLLFEKK